MTTFKIENFRALVSKELLDESYNSLIGLLAKESSAGKVTLLQCLIIKEVFEIGKEEIKKDE